MKKIISVLLVIVLLAVSVLATVTTSAADAVKEYKIDWKTLDYEVYGDSGQMIDVEGFNQNFDINKTSSTLGVSRIAYSLHSCSYVATARFDITTDTQYEYVIKVKSNTTNRYAGVPFAIDADGGVYFVYGSFDNNNDTKDSSDTIRYPGHSYMITALSDFDNKYPSPDDEGGDAKYFQKVTLESGYATVKFVYDGLTVSVYAMTSSGYTQMGYDVELPEGAQIVMGVFSRDGSDNGNRTVTVKDGVVYAMNQAAANNLVVSATGMGELKDLVASVKTDYPEANYTADSYAPLKEAVDAANEIIADSGATEDDIADAITAIEEAIEGLEMADVDTSKLEEAIAKAEALKPVEYTEISYNMVMNAVKTGKELLEDDKATQTAVDAAASEITGRIEMLVPSGVTAPDEEGDAGDGEDAGDATTDGAATDAPAGDKTTGDKKGCNSAVATSAVVIGLVATLGTALVIKKKD